MFDSVRARLTLWYCAVLAVVLAAFSIISYLLISGQIRENTDASLTDTAAEFSAAFRDESRETSSRNVLLDFRYSDREIVMLNPAGQVVARSRARSVPDSALPELRRQVMAGRTGFFTIAGGEEDDGLRSLSVPIDVLGKRFTVVVVRALHEQTDRLESAAGALFLGIPIALLMASVGGYVLARKSLAPVLDMSRKAQQISVHTLDDRIVVLNERDELGFLATTLNGLLSRLQQSFASQQQFMADASHELRTPLSIMQGEADVILSRDHRSEEEYRESLEIMQRAARKLTRIVQNLFLLARGDAGRYPIDSSRFYLDEVVTDCVRSLRTIAATNRIELLFEAPPETLMSGDEDLIHRMVLNLLDNALKYSRRGGRVTVSLENREERSVLTLADSGPGIPLEARERIFDRFHRLDPTRRSAENSGYEVGAGLGLSIVRWIAEVHGGSVCVASSDANGSRFVITLPSGS